MFAKKDFEEGELIERVPVLVVTDEGLLSVSSSLHQLSLTQSTKN